MKFVLNPYDEFAMEETLRIKGEKEIVKLDRTKIGLEKNQAGEEAKVV